jgi:hypothetical protein
MIDNLDSVASLAHRSNRPELLMGMVGITAWRYGDALRSSDGSSLGFNFVLVGRFRLAGGHDASGDEIPIKGNACRAGNTRMATAHRHISIRSSLEQNQAQRATEMKEDRGEKNKNLTLRSSAPLRTRRLILFSLHWKE